MENYPLIFDCILSDNEIQLLKEFLKSLTALSEKMLPSYSLRPKLHSVNLLHSCLDVKEIIAKNGSAGYKWTSYILRLLQIRLEFCIGVFETSSSPVDIEITESLHDLNFYLSDLLLKKWKDFACLAD